MNVRAKFRLISKEQLAYGDQIKYRFQPQYDTSVPEDRRYAKYTPSGELWIQVDNPAVSFDLGAEYYLDFTLVSEDAPVTAA